MKITKRAESLLRHSFASTGKLNCSAISTCEGTMPLWGQLVLAGLVRERERSWMGHPFSYEITNEGKQYIQA